MPKAIANINQTQRFELKSCPGGYVVIRRLSYGKKLERQEITMQMRMFQEEARRGGKGTSSMDISMMARKVAEFDFKNCVAEHNLEDDGGVTLNFSEPHYVHMLDGNIGDEVGNLINEVNTFDEGNSQGVSDPVFEAPGLQKTETPN